MTLPSHPSVDDSLARFRSLLDKQELVRAQAHGLRRFQGAEDPIVAVAEGVVRLRTKIGVKSAPVDSGSRRPSLAVFEQAGNVVACLWCSLVRPGTRGMAD
jgi:hypothetical protein